jgi:hypothetical protein
MKLDFRSPVWKRVWVRLERALEQCAQRVHELRPHVTMHWWYTGNDTFPFHATAWAPVDGDHHDQLVLSIAFPIREGELYAEADLMKEPGAILNELSPHNFGRSPTQEDVMIYLPQIERFIIDQASHIAAAVENRKLS